MYGETEDRSRDELENYNIPTSFPEKEEDSWLHWTQYLQRRIGETVQFSKSIDEHLEHVLWLFLHLSADEWVQQFFLQAAPHKNNSYRMLEKSKVR